MSSKSPVSPDSSAVALVACALQPGIAAALNQFVYRGGGTIVDYDQYVDTANSRFFARLEWLSGGGDRSREGLRRAFQEQLVEPYGLEWRLHFPGDGTRIAVFVTKEVAHLYDLLVRTISGQWKATVAMIVSNHPDLEAEAARFEIPFHCFPIDRSNRATQERLQVELLEKNEIDLVILARYMQIVSKDFIAPFEHRIINIHHSMLPAFVGAKPYHQAHARGVKLIGATSHYVTADLDAGPIIAQDVAHVDHKKSPARLIAIGRDLETKVLARAAGLHLQQRVWIDKSRTIIYD